MKIAEQVDQEFLDEYEALMEGRNQGETFRDLELELEGKYLSEKLGTEIVLIEPNDPEIDDLLILIRRNDFERLLKKAD